MHGYIVVILGQFVATMVMPFGTAIRMCLYCAIIKKVMDPPRLWLCC